MPFPLAGEGQTAALNSVLLTHGTSRAEISLQGAELRAWSVAGTPLLWSPDPALWPDTAPLLFPVVGWTRGSGITVDGRRYPLGLHGFARRQAFKVLEQWPSHVRLGVDASPDTDALYPFRWSLLVDYTLDGPALETRLTIANTGDRPMPYACGLHPGFRWPFAGGEMDDYTVIFGEREHPSVPIISSDGLFTHQSRRVPLDGRRLDLSVSLLDQEALCFLDARSRSLRFAHRSGAAIDILLEDFPHIALWSRPAGRFICVEAWTGHGDFVDADSDLFTKPSMRHLAPGASASHGARFSFAAPHLVVR